MAGIFRQLSYCGNGSINNSNNETPNKKRLSIGAFSTSPGTLQDVTMDNSYGVGYRSPCVSLNTYQGSTSPSSQQGRSVREFEEQMAALRKENFNLKLRLYFIEESIPNYQHATSSGDGPETLMKQLIDSKVEIEMLRKELQEKQELLKEAAQAMTQMEKIQQDTEAKGESMVEELKQRVQYLEMEKDIEKTRASGELMDNLIGRSNITDNMTTIQKVRELEGLVKQSEEKIYQYQAEINKMNNLVEKRDETIKELEDKVKEQAFQNAELLEQLEHKEREFSTAEHENRKLWRKNSELNRNINVPEDLEKTKYIYNKDIYEVMTNSDNDVPSMETNNLNKISKKNLLERFRNYEQLIEEIHTQITRATKENRILASCAEYLEQNPTGMFSKELAKNYADFQSTANNSMSANSRYTFENYGFQRENDDEDGDDDANRVNTNLRVSQEKSHEKYIDEEFNLNELNDRGDYVPNSADGNSSAKLRTDKDQNQTKKNKHSVTDINANFDKVNKNLKSKVSRTISNDNHRNHNNNNNTNNNIKFKHVVECFEPFLPVRYTLSEESYVYNRKTVDIPLQYSASEPSFLSINNQNTSSNFSLLRNRSVESLNDIIENNHDAIGHTDQQDASNQQQQQWKIYERKWNAMFGREIYKNAAQHLRQELQEHKSALADKLCMLDELEEKLEATKEKLQERNTVHEKACRTIQKLMTTMKRQQEKIAKYEENADENKSQSDVENASADSVGSYQQLHEYRRLENKIKEQEVLIEKLQTEVQKKTTHLQSLVNHELWEKNREIERLAASSSTAGLKPVLAQCDKCEANANEQDLINNLRMELEKARDEAENAEKWRRECADVCTVLSNRLEELAGFLNSLLKQKDVLGVLAADRRRAIRKAVDRSLDLSKSLNMTLSFSGLSMCEQSLVQLSNLSDILGDVEQNRTYNSHEETEADLLAIESLKAENKALKRELDKRRQKERRSLPLAPLKSNQSESEAWSEPDRKVSLARIGLLENEQSSSVVKDTDSDSDDMRQQNRSVANKMHTMELRITYLEQLLSERDERILETQSQLVHVDTLLKRETLRVLELEKHTNKDIVKNLQLQLEEKHATLEKLQDERDRITVEARLAELQIDVLKGEMEELRTQHAQSMQQAELEKQQKLQQLREELEKRLREQQQLHAENLKQDWVTKQEHELIQQQLQQLQQQVRQQNYNLENLQEQEQEYKESLLQAELSERSLKKQLEESTLQASKAVVERTKAIKEKLQLEQRVQELQKTLQAHEEERALLQQQIQMLESVQKQWQTVKNDQHELKQSQCGYTSEELALVSALPANKNKTSTHRGNNTSSPDLGIESDAGRLSGVDSTKVSSCSRNLNNNNQNNNHHQHNLKEELSDGPEENMMPINEERQQLLVGGTAAGITTTASSTASVHDCAKVDQENAELRRKLIRTKRAFEDTYERLRIANQKKAQMEKDIKNQILKTHNVLKNVRSNMEN